MKSNKQRRAEIMAARLVKKQKRDLRRRNALPVVQLVSGNVPVAPTALIPTNGSGVPVWQQRGFYLDVAFTCKDCGAECLWTAQRQKWWYEIAKGHPDTIAVRCKPCRAKERARKLAVCEASRNREILTFQEVLSFS
jgi:hypothetical protein